MAKKKRVKDRREEIRRAKQEQYKAAEKKRQDERIRLEKQKEKEAYERALQKFEKENEGMGKITKSKAKAAGLKSVFALGNDKLLMTSFGNGSKALSDKYIENQQINDASQEAVLKVSADGEDEFYVSGRVVQEAVTDNPLHSKKKPGQDLIHCREKLEKLYYGRNFEDNIHIQLIYNILDIEKILAVQVNNIVFQINNIRRCADAEYDDLIGYLGTIRRDDKYESFSRKERHKQRYENFKNLIQQPQMGYYGNTFLPINKDGKLLKYDSNEAESSERIEFEKRCYYLLAVLGTLRQATAHGEEFQRSSIFKFDDDSAKGCQKESRQELDRLYSKKVHELNQHFLEHSAKDIHILARVFHIKPDSKEEIEELVKEYYEFVVLKGYKNLGFSIKRLRETIIAYHASDIGDDKYSTMRARLYRAIDFVLFKYYQDKDERMAELLDRLRACTKESEKEYLYRQEANIAWTDLKDMIERQILPQMNGKSIAQIKASYDPDMLQGVFIAETADPFSEMIYLLTIFLDGKEINDMLTQLINRFDNIQSFMEVMKREGMDTPLADDYKLFEKSHKISKELRTINSFARMSDTDTKTYKEVYKAMFIDAADVLGYEENPEKLEEYIEQTFNTDRKAKGSKDRRFRNFINNNVMKSSRFKYLVRYGNPKKIKALSKNKKVIDFVLKDIPDAQIQAYYNSCHNENKDFFPEMREDLQKIITDLNFKDFVDVKQDIKDDTRKPEEQEALIDKNKKRNSIRLYLTVLYLIQKNLIYVNSRYFLAFHCVERDAMIYDKEKYSAKDEHGTSVLKNDYALFAKDFVKKYPRKKRVMQYLETNFKNADRWSFNAFRNACEHLGAIRNMDQYIGDVRTFHSNFELYHYIVQRYLINQFNHDCNTKSTRIPGTMVYSEEQAEGKLLQYFQLVEKYHSYCKDFVKALCVPFAYNLPRYKNLAINELYDRHNYLPNKGKEMETEEVWE